ncbi:MAG: hypothetical protein NTV38_04870 [Chloroflexi bacterium]|nr:hypothetical protein [Chloroflexota bacterium]
MAEKIFSLLACFILIAVLAGCGSVTGTKDSEPDQNQIEPYSNLSTPDGVHVVTLDGGISMRVLWTVSGYVIGNGSSWGEQDAKAFLFKPLDMNDTEITFGGQVCKNVTFQQETVNTAEYLSSVWQATSQTLGIEDQDLQVFKTNCTLPGFQEYMRLGDGRLIVPINGVFFFFEPTVTR